MVRQPQNGGQSAYETPKISLSRQRYVQSAVFAPIFPENFWKSPGGRQPLGRRGWGWVPKKFFASKTLFSGLGTIFEHFWSKIFFGNFRNFSHPGRPRPPGGPGPAGRVPGPRKWVKSGDSGLGNPINRSGHLKIVPKEWLNYP